jgi:hypothetical protein
VETVVDGHHDLLNETTIEFVDLFRPELDNTKADFDGFNRYLKSFRLPLPSHPRKVFLFSGHMIDAPGRTVPRFPPEKETVAAKKIAEALDQFDAGLNDIALTQGACGGDLLFTEACQQRRVKVHWLQPFREQEFIQHSVVRCSEAWHSRYLAAKARLAAPIRSAPDELGELSPDTPDGLPYERCNLWLLYTALAFGADKVRFICLWNGEGGDWPGGTEHMVNEVKRWHGDVTWINIRKI